MLKIIIVLLLIVPTLNLNAQDYSRLKEINLEDSTTCRLAEPKLIECCEFLLSHPCIDTKNSMEAGEFILSWMEINPDYKFGVSENMYNAVQNNNALLTIYYACIVKKHVDSHIYYDGFEIQLLAVKRLLKYIQTPEYNVKLNGKLKKFLAAKETGDLRGAL